MDFFTQLAALSLTGDVVLVVHCEPLTEGADPGAAPVTVSIALNNQACGDPAARRIVPVNLSGPAAEIDELFFTRLRQPLQATSELLVGMEAHLKSVEIAKQESAMAKETENAEKKEKDRQKKSYDDAMVKVAELENAGKHREAFGKLPDAETHPQFADAIAKKKTDLVATFSQGSLFAV